MNKSKPSSISFGFSPCPNDTFMFEKIWKEAKLGDLDVEFVIEDIEALNRRALNGELDVTKLSYHAFAHCTDKYQMLEHGSALGENCGPILVGRQMENLDRDNELVIAIPGEYTTANLLFTLAYPHLTNKKTMLFSDIEDAILSGTVDLGLLIHENRFTYQDKGLSLVRDLGNFWDEEMSLPIPLGGIAVKRNLSDEMKQLISKAIKESVEDSMSNEIYDSAFILDNAQEMKEEVIKNHIDLYVTEESRSLSSKGKLAVEQLLSVLEEKNQVQGIKYPIFFEG